MAKKSRRERKLERARRCHTKERLAAKCALNERHAAPDLAIPDPPKSDVRLIMRAVEVRRSPLERAVEADEDRAIDRLLRRLVNEGVIEPEGLEALAYWTTLDQFVASRSQRWTPTARDRLNSLRLWHGNNQPTEFGRELWQRFRLRMRREGALSRILEGRIIGSPATAARRRAA
ncbi:hypothetical protein HY479_01405 [Candidatus Uhrbacteria bacterium]|nr:hypothetical protein [Candidatus Uhrbacteria bacterium]